MMPYVHTFRTDTRSFKDIANHTKYCKYCGHSILFQIQTKRVICTHCGHWVYNHKIDEFKDRLLESKKRLENES